MLFCRIYCSLASYIFLVASHNWLGQSHNDFTLHKGPLNDPLLAEQRRALDPSAQMF